MSLGKLPGIKGLVSNSQGKRRFKSDLSVDMISPPLGDFRHTMHVGRGGDVFGDTSFLSNHGGPTADEEPESPPWSSKTTRFFSRTLRHVRKTPARPRTGSRDLSPPPPPVSPIIKNAVSLPQLNLDAPNGSLQRVLFPSSPVSPDDLAYSAYSYGLQSGFLTLPRLSRLDRHMQDSSGDLRRETPGNDSDSLSLTRSESISSFTVDLGPSLMSEVFAVIDSPRCGQVANHAWEDEEAGPHVTFDLTVDGGVVHSATSCGAESPPRMDWNGRGSPDIDGGENTQAFKRAVPGVSTESTPRVEPGMEPVRFQRATDVLARHYGGGGLLKTQPQTEGRENQHLCPASDSGTGTQRTAPYAYPEEEDEIKV